MINQSAPVEARPLVLVVDDNAVNREALILYLKSRGIDAVGADGAEEARLYLHYQKRIGLMITDLRMQPESGLDLIRQFARRSGRRCRSLWCRVTPMWKKQWM